MAIAIDEKGDFMVDENGDLIKSTNEPLQNYIAETRCLQTTYPFDPTFGRAYLVWTLSQAVSDRLNDLVRISKKYLTLKSISYKNGKFEIFT